METICDCCGIIIPAGEDRFEFEDYGTLCGHCYDDYCIMAYTDSEEDESEQGSGEIAD